MKMVKRAALIAATAAALIALAPSVPAFAQAAKEKCVIADSHYTGWEMIWLAKHLGILKKHGDKQNVELDVTDPMDYGESINQFAAGQFCALAVTNMDALNGPAAGGVDTTFIVVGDYSNGNDGLLWKAAKKPQLTDIVGKKVVLVEGTVSQYLLWRGAQINKFDYNKVKVENAASETDVKNAFSGNGSIIVTWNPILMAARQEKNAHLLFDSSSVPGEIIDGIVVKSGVSDNVKKAIVGAWYETLAVMAEKGSPKSVAAIDWMAKFAGNSVEEFNAQLKTTALFYTAAEAVKFTKDAKLKETMDKVRVFSAENGLLKNGAGVAQSKDFVGIQFSDGSVVGEKSNVKLRFDTTFMEMAAAGKL